MAHRIGYDRIGSLGWVGGYLRPDQFLDHLTVITKCWCLEFDINRINLMWSIFTLVLETRTKTAFSGGGTSLTNVILWKIGNYEETKWKMCNWHLWGWVGSQLLTQLSLHTFLYETVVQVKLKVKMFNTLEMPNLNPSLNLYPARKSCYFFCMFLPFNNQQSVL